MLGIKTIRYKEKWPDQLCFLIPGSFAAPSATIMQEMVPEAFFMQNCATFGVCDFDTGLCTLAIGAGKALGDRGCTLLRSHDFGVP